MLHVGASQHLGMCDKCNNMDELWTTCILHVREQAAHGTGNMLVHVYAYVQFEREVLGIPQKTSTLQTI